MNIQSYIYYKYIHVTCFSTLNIRRTYAIFNRYAHYSHRILNLALHSKILLHDIWYHQHACTCKRTIGTFPLLHWSNSLQGSCALPESSTPPLWGRWITGSTWMMSHWSWQWLFSTWGIWRGGNTAWRITEQLRLGTISTCECHKIRGSKMTWQLTHIRKLPGWFWDTRNYIYIYRYKHRYIDYKHIYNFWIN